MFKIALLDDGTENVDMVERLITQFFQKERMLFHINRFTNAANLLYDIRDGYEFDLFLLDVVLPDMSGVKLVKEIKKSILDGYIIFITSHLEYAVEGYELDIFRFILKNNIAKKLPAALRDLKNQRLLKDERSYIIRKNFSLERLLYENIYYIYKEKKYSIFVTSRGNSKERKSISAVYQSLDTNEFFLIDRGYIVHALHIAKIDKNNVFLTNGMSLAVSRTHIQEIREKLNLFWKRIA